MITRLSGLAATAAVVSAAAVAVAPPASADPTVAGTYNPLAVQRIVNTTTGTGAPKKALAPGQTLTVAGSAGIAGPVEALDLTITAVVPRANGFLTAYSGSTRPAVATVTFTKGESTPNNAPVTVDGSGDVTIYNGSTGSVDVTVDRSGYWTGGEFPADDRGLFHPLAPTRVADSRTSSPAPSRSSVTVPLGALELPAKATVVAFNLTAVTPGANGYLTATPAPSTAETAPATNTVSFTTARTRSNYSFVNRTSSGDLTLYNGAPVAVDYTVDVVGYFTGTNDISDTPAGTGGYASLRFADSRKEGGPIPAKGTRVIDFAFRDVVETVTVMITATGATAPGYLTAWNGVATRPVTSVTNFYPNTSRTGTVTVPAPRGKFSLFNGSTGSVGYTIDVIGFTKIAVPRTTSCTTCRSVASLVTDAKSKIAARQNR